MKITTSYEQIADLWDAMAGKDGKKMIAAIKVTAKNIIKEIGPLKNKKIYEIACGNGFLARKIAKQVKEVRASDISKSMIDLAINKYDSKNINYETRDAVDFKGIPNNHYDSVIIHQGIFYIEDIDKFATRVYKILKPGGTLLFSNMHPLIYVADLDIDPALKIKTVLDKYKLYLENKKVIREKEWKVKKEIKTVSYYQFKRPFSFYVNVFAKHGLPTTKIIEAKTIGKHLGKIRKSDIPSSMIIKCKKI